MKKLTLIAILALTFSITVFAECGKGNDSLRGEGSVDPVVETSTSSEVHGESIIIE